MAIQYHIQPKNFGSSESVYTARVTGSSTLHLPDLIERMVRMGSTVGEADLRGTFTLYREAVQSALEGGHRVNHDGLFSLGLSIRGTFTDTDEPFDRRRHEINVVAKPSITLKRAVARNAKVQRRNRMPVAPDIQEVHDFASGTRNEQLTPRDVCTLYGSHLKFSEDLPDEGLWLLNRTAREEVRVHRFLKVSPSEIIFSLPDLEPGLYDIRIAARPRNNKHPRTGTYGHDLIVPGP